MQKISIVLLLMVAAAIQVISGDDTATAEPSQLESPDAAEIKRLERLEKIQKLEELENMFDSIISVTTNNGTMTFAEYMEYEVNRYIHFYDSQTSFVQAEADKLLQQVDDLLSNTPEDSELLPFRRAIRYNIEEVVRQLHEEAICGVRPIVVVTTAKFLDALEDVDDIELSELWANHYSVVMDALDSVGNATEEKKARQAHFTNQNEDLNAAYTWKFNKVYRRKCTKQNTKESVME